MRKRETETEEQYLGNLPELSERDTLRLQRAGTQKLRRLAAGSIAPASRLERVLGASALGLGEYLLLRRFVPGSTAGGLGIGFGLGGLIAVPKLDLARDAAVQAEARRLLENRFGKVSSPAIVWKKRESHGF